MEEHARAGSETPFLIHFRILVSSFRHHEEPGKKTLNAYDNRGKRNRRKASIFCHSASWDIMMASQSRKSGPLMAERSCEDPAPTGHPKYL